MVRFGRRGVVPFRSAGELDAMAAGAVVGAALVAVRDATKAGVSTLELDGIAEAVIRDAGAVPSFKGYHGFPGSICSRSTTSSCTGSRVPTSSSPTATSCRSIAARSSTAGTATRPGPMAWGRRPSLTQISAKRTRLSLEAGIAAMVDGARLTDISHAIELGTLAAREKFGRHFGIVAGYGGHGIGREMHLDPFLANEGPAGRGPRLVVGSTLAIEPMLTLGTEETSVLDDDWTVVTDDGSRAAHWEHTVAVTADGPRILTPRPSA